MGNRQATRRAGALTWGGRRPSRFGNITFADEGKGREILTCRACRDTGGLVDRCGLPKQGESRTEKLRYRRFIEFLREASAGLSACMPLGKHLLPIATSCVGLVVMSKSVRRKSEEDAASKPGFRSGSIRSLVKKLRGLPRQDEDFSRDLAEIQATQPVIEETERKLPHEVTRLSTWHWQFDEDSRPGRS